MVQADLLPPGLSSPKSTSWPMAGRLKKPGLAIILVGRLPLLLRPFPRSSLPACLPLQLLFKAGNFYFAETWHSFCRCRKPQVLRPAIQMLTRPARRGSSQGGARVGTSRSTAPAYLKLRPAHCSWGNMGSALPNLHIRV